METGCPGQQGIVGSGMAQVLGCPEPWGRISFPAEHRKGEARGVLGSRQD